MRRSQLLSIARVMQLRLALNEIDGHSWPQAPVLGDHPSAQIRSFAQQLRRLFGDLHGPGQQRLSPDVFTRDEDAKGRDVVVLRTESGLVLTSPDGGPWWPSYFNRTWQRFKKRQGLAVRFHDLRHSHATQLLAAGVHVKIVSERLGHASVGITLDTYSHAMPALQEEAAEKIDAGLRAALSS